MQKLSSLEEVRFPLWCRSYCISILFWVAVGRLGVDLGENPHPETSAAYVIFDLGLCVTELRFHSSTSSCSLPD